MVKKLEVKTSELLDIKKVKDTYKPGTMNSYERVYACDCDQWGGDTPCDCNR